MKVIIYERAGGNLSIIHPAPNSRRKDESEEDWLRRIAERSVPKGQAFVLLDESALPRNRRWRNAWRLLAGKLQIDPQQGKRLRKAELLLQRDKLLQQLRDEIDDSEDNQEMMKADELRKKRKRLRRLETSLDEQMKELSTLENVDKFIPTELQGD